MPGDISRGYSGSADAAALEQEAADEIERLTAELKWVAEQRWNENADLDDICTRAERSIALRAEWNGG